MGKTGKQTPVPRKNTRKLRKALRGLSRAVLYEDGTVGMQPMYWEDEGPARGHWMRCKIAQDEDECD